MKQEWEDNFFSVNMDLSWLYGKDEMLKRHAIYNLYLEVFDL